MPQSLCINCSLRYSSRPTTVAAAQPSLEQALAAPLHTVPSLPHLPLLRLLVLLLPRQLGGALSDCIAGPDANDITAGSRTPPEPQPVHGPYTAGQRQWIPSLTDNAARRPQAAVISRNRAVLRLARALMRPPARLPALPCVDLHSVKG